MEWEGWDGDAFEECNIECRRSSDTRENSSLAKNRSDRKLFANGISEDRDFLFVKKNPFEEMENGRHAFPFVSNREKQGIFIEIVGRIIREASSPSSRGKSEMKRCKRLARAA